MNFSSSDDDIQEIVCTLPDLIRCTASGASCRRCSERVKNKHFNRTNKISDIGFFVVKKNLLLVEGWMDSIQWLAKNNAKLFQHREICNNGSFRCAVI